MPDGHAQAYAYRSFLEAMHRHTRPRVYLEIGVKSGGSLQSVMPSTRVIGIDPNPQLTPPTPSRWHIYAETSDEFFARPDVATMLRKVDVAFIDGLHLFEQALRDFMNLERSISPGGVVLLHDCLPLDASWTGRTVKTKGAWSGDVWKLLPILHEHRPDLTVTVLDIAPSGLAIVTGLDASNQRLHERYDDIVAQYLDREYRRWPGTQVGSWDTARDLFPVFRRRSLSEEFEPIARRGRSLAGCVRGRWRRSGIGT